MARKYPNRNFNRLERYEWNGGANYKDIIVESLAEVRTSANNKHQLDRIASTASIQRIKRFVTPMPVYSDGKVASYIDPGYAPVTDPNWSLPIYAALHKKNVDKLFDKIKEGNQNFNAAAAFAERRDAIELVSGYLGKAYRVARMFRKPLKSLEKKRRRHPDNIKIGLLLAKKRLEFSYGIAPLMGDIYAASKAFPPPTDLFVKASSRDFGTKEYVTSVVKAVEQGSYVATHVVRLRLDMPFVASASSLGLSNPALLAWELVPYSFVIDWFLPIGSYLENLSALHGYKVIEAGRTLGYRGMSNKVHKPTGAYSSSYFRYMRRGAFSLNAQLPSFKNPLSISHALNALALIRVLNKD